MWYFKSNFKVLSSNNLRLLIPGGHGVFMGMINCFVHVIMYTYYLITNYKPEYKKNIWWKKHITQMQMVSTKIFPTHMFQPETRWSCFRYNSWPSLSTLATFYSSRTAITRSGLFSYFCLRTSLCSCSSGTSTKKLTCTRRNQWKVRRFLTTSPVLIQKHRESSFFFSFLYLYFIYWRISRKLSDCLNCLFILMAKLTLFSLGFVNRAIWADRRDENNMFEEESAEILN